jgi:hypothetical protein
MNMKTLLTMTLPLLLLSSIATGQSERTFVKTFNLQSKHAIQLNLGSDVQVIPWDSDLLRIQMTVSLDKLNDATLKAFAETGRYTLKSEIKDETYTISAPLLKNLIKINGNIVAESIKYVIYAPKGIELMQNGELNKKVVAKLNP